MKTVSMRRANRLAVSGQFNPLRVARGHAPRKSGAGVHDDRRLRRERTRGAQVRRALAEG